MENTLPKYYKFYGDAVNASKMIPNAIDGLLPIYKRLLLSCHDLAKNKLVKTATVIGHCCGNYHHHAITELPISLLEQNDFIEGEGAWNLDYGTEEIPCAAMRYTSVKSKNYIEEMAFKYVDYVDWISIEGNPEPINLPTLIPFCLFAKSETILIAFGLKVEIPCYNLNDLLNRSILLLTNEKSFPVLYPNIKGCQILSSIEEIKKLEETGTGKLDIQGMYEIDEKDKKIYIRGWSPRRKFQNILDKIDKYNNYNLLSNNDIGWIDISTEQLQTCVQFEILKQRNVDIIFEKMKEAIDNSLKSTISYNMYFVDNRKVDIYNINTLLLKCYNYYKNAFNKFLLNKIEKINNSIYEYTIILDIRQYLDQCIEMLNNKKEMDEIYLFLKTSLNDKYMIDEFKIIFDKYKIKKLFDVNLDIKNLQNQLEIYQNKLINIDSEIINEYKQLLLIERN